MKHYRLKDYRNGFLDFGSNSIVPAMFAADLSGCPAQVFIKKTIDIKEWVNLLGELETEDFTKRWAISKRVSIVRDYPLGIKCSFRFFGALSKLEADVTHVLIPFNDSDDQTVVKLLNHIFKSLLTISPVKMIACFISPWILKDKYEALYLKCIGSVRSRSK
jgi:hypothetical protein